MEPLQTPPKKLLDQVRDVIRVKHYSYRTEETYVQWIHRYILFHNKRHPKEMGVPEIEAFLGVSDSRYEPISVGIGNSFKFLQNHTAIQQSPFLTHLAVQERVTSPRSYAVTD